MSDNSQGADEEMMEEEEEEEEESRTYSGFDKDN